MPNHPCSPPLPGPERAKDYLVHYCFETSKKAGPWFAYGLPTLVTLAVFLLLWGLSSLPGVPMALSGVLSLFSPIITFGLLIAGLWQWRTARREMSMDQYYERLNIANQCWKSSPSVRKMMAGFTKDSEDQDLMMYVCLEIDNLEYVIEKYRIGYVDHEQAFRGLKTFQVRCLASAEFKQIARRRVHLGDYTPRTSKVVCRVCDEIDNLIEHYRSSQLASGISPENQTHVHIAAAAAIHVTSDPPSVSAAGKDEGRGNSVLEFGRRSSDHAAGSASSESASTASDTATGKEDSPPARAEG